MELARALPKLLPLTLTLLAVLLAVPSGAQRSVAIEALRFDATGYDAGETITAFVNITAEFPIESVLVSISGPQGLVVANATSCPEFQPSTRIELACSWTLDRGYPRGTYQVSSVSVRDTQDGGVVLRRGISWVADGSHRDTFSFDSPTTHASAPRLLTATLNQTSVAPGSSFELTLVAADPANVTAATVSFHDPVSTRVVAGHCAGTATTTATFRCMVQVPTDMRHGNLSVNSLVLYNDFQISTSLTGKNATLQPLVVKVEPATMPSSPTLHQTTSPTSSRAAPDVTGIFAAAVVLSLARSRRNLA